MPPPPQAPAVELADVVKRYGGRTVVDHVSLRLDGGQLCALLGPNGAGKTTLSECIGGFRTPDAGRVRVFGRDPHRERSQVAAQLGVMLQEGGGWPAATPREMLRLHVRFHRRSASVGTLLDRVGLTDHADQRYRRLSGGQKQRLGLALALVGSPRALVLDEPTAAMDPTGRAATWELLRDLRTDGVTVLFTTHDLREAERLADRVVVIDRGRIVADDRPARLAAAGPQPHLVVTTPARLDRTQVAALARRAGATVRADGDGRWLVETGSTGIATVTTWFAEHGLPLTGVTTGGADLEAVFARLVNAPADGPTPDHPTPGGTPAEDTGTDGPAVHHEAGRRRGVRR